MNTPIVTREPILVIADIIQSELGLVDDAVMLDYEKFNINPDPGLYVVLSYVSGKAIGNNNYGLLAADGTITEVQQAAMHQIIQIDAMSFDASARTRKEEIVMALRSIYSQQQQEENTMQIARIPSEFLNASSLEETKIMNRFTLSIAVFSIYTKTKAAPYYDKFQNLQEVINI